MQGRVAAAEQLERTNVDDIRRIQELTNRDSSLAGELQAATALADGAADTLNASRNNYCVASRAINRKGQAFFERHQRALRDSLVEFAADVLVQRMVTVAVDPELVPAIHNSDGLNPFRDASILKTARRGAGPSGAGPS